MDNKKKGKGALDREKINNTEARSLSLAQAELQIKVMTLYPIA